MGETKVDAVDQARTIIFGCLERNIFTMNGRPAAHVHDREGRSRADDGTWSRRSVALLIFCLISWLAVIVWSLGCFAAACP
jgi:hypothetical protein